MSRSAPLVADPFDAADIGSTEPVADKEVRRKQIHDTAFAKHWRSVVAIKYLLESDDPDMYSIAEAWGEIPQDDQLALWLAPTKGGIFTTAERSAIKSGIPEAMATNALRQAPETDKP